MQSNRVSRQNAHLRAAIGAVSVEVQLLESRRMLSAVTVGGSSQGDEIRVYVQSNTIVTEVNGIIQSYPDFLYDGIVINALGGADTIHIISNSQEPVTINGGSGTDTITLAQGSLDVIESSVSIVASAGDQLYLDDSADDFGETYNITGDTIQNNFFAGVIYSGIGQVHLTSGFQADTFNVSNTVGVPIVIDGRGSADILNLNTGGAGTAEVVFESTQDLARISSNTGGRLTLRGDAGVLLTTNQSDVEGDIFLERGFIVETDSQAIGGLNYWRDRLVNASNNVSPQVRSTQADSTAINDTVGYGYAQNTALTTIGGLTLNSGDLVLRYALRGDVDLSGTVDFDDLLKVAQNYSPTATGRSWSQGDFNLSGKTDFDDLLPLAQNYGATAIRASSRPTARVHGNDLLE